MASGWLQQQGMRRQHEQAALALLLLCCSFAGGAIRFTLSLRLTLHWTLWPAWRALASPVAVDSLLGYSRSLCLVPRLQARLEHAQSYRRQANPSHRST